MMINTLGIFLAGRICDRLTTKGHTDAPIWVCFGTAVAVVITSALPAFMPSATLGLAMMCVAGLAVPRLRRDGPDGGEPSDAEPDACAGVGGLPVHRESRRPRHRPDLVPMISDYILRDPMQIRWGLLVVVVTCGHDRRDPAVARPRDLSPAGRADRTLAIGGAGRRTG